MLESWFYDIANKQHRQFQQIYYIVVRYITMVYICYFLV